jgi:hypothetical protein
MTHYRGTGAGHRVAVEEIRAPRTVHDKDLTISIITNLIVQRLGKKDTSRVRFFLNIAALFQNMLLKESEGCWRLSSVLYPAKENKPPPPPKIQEKRNTLIIKLSCRSTIK